MMKSGIIVFLTTVMFGRVASQCDAMNCDNYDLLTQENSLGLIGSDEVDGLCRIINQLDMCISRQIKNCNFDQRKQFEPALNSAKVICQNSDAYKQAGQCYFNLDVEEAFEICLEDLVESNPDRMTCGGLTTYQNCITTDKSVRDQCSKEDIELLNAITTASVQTFLIKYNCVATTTVTAQQSTTMTSTTITASKTTLNSNDSSGSAPMPGMVEGRASSMENSFVLSVLTLLSVLIALCLDL